jgi:hypothetical protein
MCSLDDLPGPLTLDPKPYMCSLYDLPGPLTLDPKH